jgi:hypothetical protein
MACYRDSFINVSLINQSTEEYYLLRHDSTVNSLTPVTEWALFLSITTTHPISMPYFLLWCTKPKHCVTKWAYMVNWSCSRSHSDNNCSDHQMHRALNPERFVTPRLSASCQVKFRASFSSRGLPRIEDTRSIEHSLWEWSGYIGQAGCSVGARMDENYWNIHLQLNKSAMMGHRINFGHRI